MHVELDMRLLELYKNRKLQPSDPSGMYPRACPSPQSRMTHELELLIAVQASLRQQVSSLEDDAWIYEAEKKAPA